MKAFFLGVFVCFFLFMMLFMYLHRVGGSPRHDASGPNDTYQEWEAKTREVAVVPSAEQLPVWIGRVQDAFTPFEKQRAAEYFPKAYADSFYFRDAFHLYTEIEPMTQYMVDTATEPPTEPVTFTFWPLVMDGINVMLPWTMILNDGQQSMGVSHLRFDADGKVIFSSGLLGLCRCAGSPGADCQWAD